MTWLEPMLVAVGVLAGDQASKALVTARTAPAAVKDRSFLSLRPVMNRRGALASFLGTPALLALWAFSLAIAVLLLQQEMLGMLGAAGIGAVIGGATGNLLDWLRRGAIVDFITIGPWPVFNLADSAIVVGFGLILLSMR